MCLMACISLHKNHMLYWPCPLPLWSSHPGLSEVLFPGLQPSFLPQIKLNLQLWHGSFFFKSRYCLPSFRCRDSQCWILSIINQIQCSLFLDYSNNYCCSLNSDCSQSSGFKVGLIFVAPVVGLDPLTRSGLYIYICLSICFFSSEFLMEVTCITVGPGHINASAEPDLINADERLLRIFPSYHSIWHRSREDLRLRTKRRSEQSYQLSLEGHRKWVRNKTLLLMPLRVENWLLSWVCLTVHTLI